MKLNKYMSAVAAIMLCTFLFASVGFADDKVNVSTDAVMKHLAVGADDIAYTVYPAKSSKVKKTFVVIHGAFMNSFATTGVAEGLSKHYVDANVVQLDLPGHGFSKGQPRTEVSAIADVVKKFIVKAQEDGDIDDDIVLVGWSMGGSISLELDLKGLKGIQNIVLLNSAPEWSIFNGMETIPASILHGVIVDILKGDYSVGTTLEQQEEFAANIDKYVSSPETVYADLQALVSLNIRDQLKEVKSPTLIISSTLDTAATVATQNFMDEEIKKSDLVLIDGDTHSMLMKQPATIVSEISNFVK